MNIAGIVLCGGRSSRMGRSKAWLPFGKETLLQHIVRVLQEAVHPVIVVASPSQELPPLPGGAFVVYDQVENRGPLAGLAAGLAGLPAHAGAAYVSGCDVPLLTPAFVRCVVGLLDGFDAAAPCTRCPVEAVSQQEALLQPLAAVYRREVLPIALGLLRSNNSSLAALLNTLNVRRITAAELEAVDPNLTSLWNVNTPEDYAAVIALQRPNATDGHAAP